MGCPPKYGLETIVDSDQACSVSRNRLNQITGAASPSMVYTKTSTSCNGAAPVASWSYWTATPIADSESVAFSLRSL